MRSHAYSLSFSTLRIVITRRISSLLAIVIPVVSMVLISCCVFCLALVQVHSFSPTQIRNKNIYHSFVNISTRKHGNRNNRNNRSRNLYCQNFNLNSNLNRPHLNFSMRISEDSVGGNFVVRQLTYRNHRDNWFFFVFLLKLTQDG